MSNKHIRISITSALNAAGIEATKSQVASMGRVVEKTMAEVSKSNHRHWADVKAAWDMGCAAIRTAWRGITAMLSKAFKFETTTRQFKFLIGNIDEAKRHMQDLKELGDTPPFSLEEFAKASRSMMVMSNGVLGYKKSMEMVGDAAAAIGRPIEEVGEAVGRLYALIRDGQPISRATLQLRNMGAITPEVAKKLQDLQDAGASTTEMWREVERHFARYNGAMKETEGTGEGLMGAIKSRWENIVRKFGQAFEDAAKDGMGEMLETMEDLEDSDAIDKFAKRTATALNAICKAANWVIDVFGQMWDHLEEGYEWSKAMRGEGEYSEEALKNAEKFELVSEEQENPYTVKKVYKGDKGSERVTYVEDLEEKKKYLKMQRRAERAAREKERRAREEARIAEDLAEAQRKIDERNAKELAEKRAEEERKLAEMRAEESRKAEREAEREAEARARAEERAAEKEARERRKAAEDEVKKQMENIRKLHAERMAALDEEHRKALKEAAKLEEIAARARGGKTFGQWQHGERQIEREQRRADDRQKKVVENAQKELARLEKTARRGRGFRNAHDMERIAKLREFILDQDPNNNPALKKAQQLEAEKLKAAKDTAKRLDDIAKKLDAITL